MAATSSGVTPVPPDTLDCAALQEKMTELVYTALDDATRDTRLAELRTHMTAVAAGTEEAEVRDELERRTADDAELLRCLHTRRFDVQSSAKLLDRHVKCVRWLNTLSTGDFAGHKVTVPAPAPTWEAMSEAQAQQIRLDSGFRLLGVRDKGGASVIFLRMRNLLDGVMLHSLRGVMLAAIKGMDQFSYNDQTRVCGFTYVFSFEGVGMREAGVAIHADVRTKFASEFKTYGVASMPWRIAEVWLVDVPFLLKPICMLFKGLYKDRGTMMKRFHICGKGDKEAAELMKLDTSK